MLIAVLFAKSRMLALRKLVLFTPQHGRRRRVPVAETERVAQTAAARADRRVQRSPFKV